MPSRPARLISRRRARGTACVGTRGWMGGVSRWAASSLRPEISICLPSETPNKDLPSSLAYKSSKPTCLVTVCQGERIEFRCASTKHTLGRRILSCELRLKRNQRTPADTFRRQNRWLTPRLSAGGCAAFLLFNRLQQRPQIPQPLVDPPQIVVRPVYAQRVQIGVLGVL